VRTPQSSVIGLFGAAKLEIQQLSLPSMVANNAVTQFFCDCWSWSNCFNFRARIFFPSAFVNFGKEERAKEKAHTDSRQLP
jgi:hypothetical protein